MLGAQEKEKIYIYIYKVRWEERDEKRKHIKDEIIEKKRNKEINVTKIDNNRKKFHKEIERLNIFGHL